MTPRKTRLSFYDAGPLLSYNAQYNGCVGGRGLGKTYFFKRRSIRKALDLGRQFIYLRRYEKELAAARATFFADVSSEFPDWEFRTFGNKAQGSPVILDIEGESENARKKREKERVWRTLGYFIALSTAQKQKSVSFPDVDDIIFDEFIIEKGNLQYIPEEVNVFNNFYSTVDRWNDRVRVWFLANSVSIMNPYFIAWKVRPDEGNEFVQHRFGKFRMVFHFPDAEKFKAEVYATAFGQFIQGTEYGEYAVGNSFSDNHDLLIDLKDYRATYLFTLETQHGIFSVWNAREKNKSPYGGSVTYYVQKKLPKHEILFTLVPEKMGEDKVLMMHSDTPIVNLRTAFRTGNVKFDDPSTRNIFIDIFDR